jgi:hypothetical protein
MGRSSKRHRLQAITASHSAHTGVNNAHCQLPDQTAHLQDHGQKFCGLNTCEGRAFSEPLTHMIRIEPKPEVLAASRGFDPRSHSPRKTKKPTLAGRLSRLLGGGWLTVCRQASRADVHWCRLLRVKRPAGGEQARSACHGVRPQSGK